MTEQDLAVRITFGNEQEHDFRGIPATKQELTELIHIISAYLGAHHYLAPQCNEAASYLRAVVGMSLERLEIRGPRNQ